MQKAFVNRKLNGVKECSKNLILFVLMLFAGCSQSEQQTLSEQEFVNPSSEFKPLTWFHVMSGNMSKEGLTKDLEAMNDAGIGGLILFNVTHFIPHGNVKFNSPDHIDLIAHAAAECERLGLSFGVHNCDGWRNSGGPWVKPEHSMKQVVFSEILVEGGPIDMQLQQPTMRADFYEDIAVLAYPALESEINDTETEPIISSSDPLCDIQLVNDGRADKITKLSGSVNKRAWIQFDFGKPKTIRSVYINLNKRIADRGRTWLLTSNDGKTFETARELKILRMGKVENGFDDVFEGITAQYFRVETEVDFDLMEMDLSSTRRYDNMLARTSLFQRENYQLHDLETPDESMIIKKESILDLTSKTNRGRLLATLPPGKWTIMRFGFTSTGAKNGPASPEGTGLEVDKMNREAFKEFYEGYVRNVINATKKVAPQALQYIEIDSYEVGGQNWTNGYENHFQEKYGYELSKFLPLYAGRFVESAEYSNQVLWDIRKLNSDLITTNYFGYFNELCNEDGLLGYAEPYSFNGPFNELDAGGQVDIPMGEFWMHQRFQTETAVSSARIYGKPVISAEAFSALPEINWRSHPGFMKLTGDIAWTLGINEFMFHRFAHQANTKVAPGMTMSQWGSHIDRTQTWWDSAGKAWFKYIARGQYLLRQGKPVSDLLIFVGDGSPNSIVRRSHFKPEIPNSINFDCVNSDALINRVTPQNGKLVLPDGIVYNALVLFNSKEISIEILRKINALADEGVIIIGSKPEKPGGYNTSPKEIAEFSNLVKNIWSKTTSYSYFEWFEIFENNNMLLDLEIVDRIDINYIHRKTPAEDIYFFYNPDSVEETFNCRFKLKGKIPELWNQTTGEITRLAQFSEVNEHTNVPITLPAEGAVFVVFRESSEKVDAVASVLSKNDYYPELILNESNSVETLVSESGSYTIEYNSGKKKSIEINDLPAPVVPESPWNVKFQNYGLDTTVVFKKLIDWKDHEAEQIEYYSGTATYTSSFNLNEEYFDEDKTLILDLGKVSIAARVFVNEQEFGVLWSNPFHIDVTNALKIGENTMKVEVTNTWTNRLIGDENYPNNTGYDLKVENMPDWYTSNSEPEMGERKAFCTFPFYEKGDQLESSGLLGPVRLVISTRQIVNP